ncbi:MAG TPA: hypothetical protein VF625_16985 [Longimicrobium sp.]
MSAPVPDAAVAAAAGAARTYLRVADGAEEAALAGFARAAFAMGEAFTGAAFVVRAHEDVAPAAAVWTPLAWEPVTAITGVTALPVAGAPSVLPVGAYAVDIDADGRGWVRVTASPGAARVAVAYQAGLAATWEALPAAVRQGVVAMTAALFEDRAGLAGPPPAVAALWRPWRRMRLTGTRLTGVGA